VRTYISDIIPRIQKFSQKLDNLTLLTNQHWVVIDEIDNNKNVYIFRQNNELLISQNGKVEKAKWEYLGNNSILIDRNSESYLFKHGFFDENILALKIDSKDEYVFLVNETKFEVELNSSYAVFDFLKKKYIDKNITKLNSLSIESEKLKILELMPNHKKIKVSENKSLLGNITKKYIIEFENGMSGEIYVENDNESYILEKNSWNLLNTKLVYINIEYCINALYYFLKTDNILLDGFIDRKL
jgi:hypothetical protein